MRRLERLDVGDSVDHPAAELEETPAQRQRSSVRGLMLQRSANSRVLRWLIVIARRPPCLAEHRMNKRRGPVVGIAGGSLGDEARNSVA